jgi:hypothetical protein
VFGWWMAPDFRISFWRPLSSLTHVLDHLLWPRSSVLAHAHSMLWFAALLAVLGTLYRRFHTPWIAHLPLLLYAVDDARGWVLGWTCPPPRADRVRRGEVVESRSGGRP